jgi:hypothetical protein
MTTNIDDIMHPATSRESAIRAKLADLCVSTLREASVSKDCPVSVGGLYAVCMTVGVDLRTFNAALALAVSDGRLVRKGNLVWAA